MTHLTADCNLFQLLPAMGILRRTSQLSGCAVACTNPSITHWLAELITVAASHNSSILLPIPRLLGSVQHTVAVRLLTEGCPEPGPASK